MLRRFSAEARREDGQALVEFAISFPLQLFLIFGIMQLALLYVSNLVVNYAAYKACRAAIVAQMDPEADPITEAREAAAIVLSPLAGTSIDAADRGDPLLVPGWGELHGSDIAMAKVLVHDQSDDSNPETVKIVVEFDQELFFPVVDRFFVQYFKMDSNTDEEMVFGDEDTAFEGLAEKTPVYGDPDRGRIRMIGGAYHVVIVRECSMYRDTTLLNPPG